MDPGQWPFSAPPVAGHPHGNGPGGQCLQPETSDQCARCPPPNRTDGINPAPFFHYPETPTPRTSRGVGLACTQGVFTQPELAGLVVSGDQTGELKRCPEIAGW